MSIVRILLLIALAAWGLLGAAGLFIAMPVMLISLGLGVGTRAFFTFVLPYFLVWGGVEAAGIYYFLRRR